jgi:hypothetical protein
MKEASSSGMTPASGRSGRTPAEPYPPVDEDSLQHKVAIVQRLNIQFKANGFCDQCKGEMA